jgi:hypothetical protein
LAEDVEEIIGQAARHYDLVCDKRQAARAAG